MDDVAYLVITAAFFLICAAYVRGCEKLRGSASDE